MKINQGNNFWSSLAQSHQWLGANHQLQTVSLVILEIYQSLDIR